MTRDRKRPNVGESKTLWARTRRARPAVATSNSRPALARMVLCRHHAEQGRGPAQGHRAVPEEMGLRLHVVENK